MSPDALLALLRTRSYVMLQPSPVHGIGVFAIAPIPRGCRDMFGPPDPPDAWTAIPRADIDSLPAPARHLVETYCLYDATHYFVPSHGFTRMDVSLFLNHSAQPNVVSVDDGEYFEALRDITVGEELLIDYGALVDDA